MSGTSSVAVFIIVFMFFLYGCVRLAESESASHHLGQLFGRWARRPLAEKLFILVFVALMVAYGGSKTNSVPEGGGNNLVFVPIAGDGGVGLLVGQESLPPRLTTNQYAAGFALVRAFTNSASWLAAPSNAVVHAPWTRYGVAEDTFWLPTNGWAFVLGTNAVDGVHVSSSGALSFGLPKSSPRAALLPAGADMNFLAPLQASLGTVPPDGRFWHAVTPSNSLLCTWQDVYAGRDSNSVVSFQAELFWNGDFAYRYAFTAAPALTNFAVGAQNRGGGETYALNAANLLADGLELRWRAFGLLDPGVDDHDGDGLSTYDEVMLYGTNPSLKDSDRDGLEDADELAAGTDPVNPDTDGDGLADGVDPQPTVWNDSAAEVSGSGMTYGEVVLNGLDPATNWTLDSDYDGWPDWKEVMAGTATNDYYSSPQNADWSFKLFDATVTLGADLPCPVVLNVGGHTLVLQKAGSWKLILKEGVAYDLALAAPQACTVALSCSLTSSFAALQPANGVFTGGAAVPGGAQVACGVIAQPTLRIHPDTVCFHSGSPKSVSVEVVPDMAGACAWEWTGGAVSAPSARHTNIAWGSGADAMCVYFTATGASSARQSFKNVTRCLRTEAADWCDSHDCEHSLCACDSGAAPEAWCGFHGQPVSKCGGSICGHHNCPYTECPDDGWCHAHNQELTLCTHAWHTPSEPPGGGGETNGARRVYGRGEDMTVAVNNDDDDADQTSDAEDGEVAGGDDDLAELWPAGGVFGLCCPCPAHRAESVMSAALVSGTGNLALYSSTDKAAGFGGDVPEGQPVYVEGAGASPSPWSDRLLWSWTDADNNVHYVTNRVTVLSVRLFGDMDLDDDVDAADRALRPAATNAWGWAMPAATNVFRPVRLRTDVGLSGGRYTLTLAGDAGAFRVWSDASGTNGAPLLACGQTVTNGENGVTFLTAADTDLYVEAVSNGTATLTYAYTGTGGAAGISCEDSLKMTGFGMALAADYDRDGNIGDADHHRAATNEVFRFWINDDDDEGFADDTKAGKQDIPGAVSGWLEFDGRDPDWENGTVDGERDWVDFFPVFVDMKKPLDLLGTSEYRYYLKQTDGAVNAYIPNDLAPTNAAAHLRNYAFAHAHAAAAVQQITPEGIELPSGFLSAVQNNGMGIILLEGRSVSESGALTLEIRKTDGKPVVSCVLPLSLSSVESMFLHKNLRVEGGGTAKTTDRADAPNWPDGLCNGKHVVFIHGYSVNEQGARGWHTEMFKRLHWSGSDARFHAVTWYGNESQDWSNLYKCPKYHNNVVNAWETAPALRDYLTVLRQGDAHVCLMAHSLGNMVASCALALDPDAAAVYLMLNGAVASEAFDASQANDNMTHCDWTSYGSPPELRAAEWHTLFGTNDLRSGLTWQGRFASIASKTVNFYSSGDQVFDIHLKDNAPDVFEGLWHVNDGRFAWAFQEKRKGSSTFAGGDSYTFSQSSGWRFNTENEPDGWNLATQDPEVYEFISPAQASNLSTNLAQLITRPFFGMGSGEYRSSLFTTNAATANAWLGNATNEWRVLAGAIPAKSLAAGRANVNSLENRNVNMNTIYNPDGNTGIKSSNWPDRGGDDWLRKNWLHSDIRNMAYLYTYRVFDTIVIQGGIK